jgi:hypothetical protein
MSHYAEVGDKLMKALGYDKYGQCARTRCRAVVAERIVGLQSRKAAIGDPSWVAFPSVRRVVSHSPGHPHPGRQLRRHLRPGRALEHAAVRLARLARQPAGRTADRTRRGGTLKPLANPVAYAQDALAGASAVERARAERRAWFMDEGFGYNAAQSTRPQTLGYALADSPAGLLGWILEKLVEWTDDYPWTDDEGARAARARHRVEH